MTRDLKPAAYYAFQVGMIWGVICGAVAAFVISAVISIVFGAK